MQNSPKENVCLLQILYYVKAEAVFSHNVFRNGAENFHLLQEFALHSSLQARELEMRVEAPASKGDGHLEAPHPDSYLLPG